MSTSPSRWKEVGRSWLAMKTSVKSCVLGSDEAVRAGASMPARR